jgi:hypothetical protein
MSMKNANATVSQQKAQITRTMERLNVSLLSAKNAFYSVLTLQEMESILEAEIQAWLNWSESQYTGDEDKDQEIMNKAAEFIADLQGILKKVSDHKAPLVAEALTIEETYVRTHVVKSKKIIPLK